jgi:hypothetical protein
MKTTQRLIAQLQEADRLAEAGQYEEAVAVFSRSPSEYRNWHEWTITFDQECREKAVPELDLRAYVLDQFEGKKISLWWNGGLAPRDLIGYSNHDRRITSVSLGPVVDALVAEGKLVYKNKLLWLPEKWEQEKQKRVARAKSTRERTQKVKF